MNMPDADRLNFSGGASELPIAAMVVIAEQAGRHLLSAFSCAARPGDRDDLMAAVGRNEALVDQSLRGALAALRPAAGWLESDNASAPLPSGEWWVVDCVEGNVNHVHGLPDWGVSIALLRDRQPVAAVVHQPLETLTWTAVRGGGSFRNGKPIRVSSKTQLDAAVVTTGQAEAGQIGTHLRIRDSVTAMLDRALLVRMSVPSTFPMLLLANGQNDVFWQYAPALSGIAAGVLMVTEAGGVASCIDGAPWLPGAPDILLAAPGLHRAAVDALRPCTSREFA